MWSMCWLETNSQPLGTACVLGSGEGRQRSHLPAVWGGVGTACARVVGEALCQGGGGSLGTSYKASCSETSVGVLKLC